MFKSRCLIALSKAVVNMRLSTNPALKKRCASVKGSILNASSPQRFRSHILQVRLVQEKANHPLL